MAEQTLMETDINYAGKGGIYVKDNVSKKANVEYALTDNSFKCSVLSFNWKFVLKLTVTQEEMVSL